MREIYLGLISYQFIRICREKTHFLKKSLVARCEFLVSLQTLDTCEKLNLQNEAKSLIYSELI